MVFLTATEIKVFCKIYTRPKILTDFYMEIDHLDHILFARTRCQNSCFFMDDYVWCKSSSYFLYHKFFFQVGIHYYKECVKIGPKVVGMEIAGRLPGRSLPICNANHVKKSWFSSKFSRFPV